MLDAYYIDKYEITNARYAECVADGVCQPPTDTTSKNRSSYYGVQTYDNYPVVYVAWSMADAYCKWREARLPTEAEWEKAARGTDRRLYPWGDDKPNCDLANYHSCPWDTASVSSYPEGTSPFGAYGMAGNVWEWVADWYGADYYGFSPMANPPGPTSGDSKVLRGGSWLTEKAFLRVISRIHVYPQTSSHQFGFRCAKDAP